MGISPSLHTWETAQDYRSMTQRSPQDTLGFSSVSRKRNIHRLYMKLVLTYPQPLESNWHRISSVKSVLLKGISLYDFYLGLYAYRRRDNLIHLSTVFFLKIFYYFFFDHFNLFTLFRNAASLGMTEFQRHWHGGWHKIVWEAPLVSMGNMPSYYGI